jgi:hypothetical protein
VGLLQARSETQGLGSEAQAIRHRGRLYSERGEVVEGLRQYLPSCRWYLRYFSVI